MSHLAFQPESSPVTNILTVQTCTHARLTSSSFFFFYVILVLVRNALVSAFTLYCCYSIQLEVHVNTFLQIGPENQGTQITTQITQNGGRECTCTSAFVLVCAWNKKPRQHAEITVLSVGGASMSLWCCCFTWSWTLTLCYIIFLQDFIHVFIFIIVNECCSQPSLFPLKRKLVYVIPLFKTGSKHNFVNYRPVSLLAQFSKILKNLLITDWTHL